MLNFVICSTNVAFSKRLQHEINTYMKQVALPYNVSYINDNFTLCENTARNCSNIINIYIIDTKLNTKINGIDLAVIIRKYDCLSYIILLTDKSQIPIKIFQYNLKVLDYIQKNNIDFKVRLTNCLKTIITETKLLLESYSLNNSLLIKSNNILYNINQNTIIYIETNVVTKKLLLHTSTSILPFKCTLEKCERSLGENFIRSHRAYIINKSHIQKLNLTSMTILMSNNDTCLLSTRKLPIFKNLCL